MHVIAIIPARGGSRRVPKKNSRLLNGRPLIAYTIEAARTASSITRSLVSTDDPDIARIAVAEGCEVPFVRPAELATDESSSVDVLIHAVDWLEANSQPVDVVVLLQPTSPMRNAGHIDSAVGLFYSSGAATVLSVSKARSHPFWCWKASNSELVPYFSLDHIMLARGKLPPALLENGAIYIFKRELLRGGTIYGDHVVGYLMDPAESIDIDTAQDFDHVESVIRQRNLVA